jgi:hypothetical protein
MQLSVSTSPAEPNLAALLLGGEAPADASCIPGSAEGAPPFASLFPDLAAGTAVASAPGGMAAPGEVIAGASTAPDAAAPWIGSTCPRPPSGPKVDPKAAKIMAPATSPDAEIVALSEEDFPASTVETPSTGTPSRPASQPSGRPAPRGRRSDETAPVPPMVAPELLPLPVATTVPTAPVTSAFADTTSTPVTDTAVEAFAEAAPESTPGNSIFTEPRPGSTRSGKAPVSAPTQSSLASSPSEKRPRSAAVGAESPAFAGGVLPPSPALVPVTAATSATETIEDPAVTSEPVQPFARFTSPRAARPPSASLPMSAASDAPPASASMATFGFDESEFESTSAATSMAASSQAASLAPADIFARQFPTTSLPAAIASEPAAVRSNILSGLPSAPRFTLSAEAPAPVAPALVPDASTATVTAATTPLLEQTQAAVVSATGDNNTPDLRLEKPSAARGAKIAAPSRNSAAAKYSASVAPEKTFLSASEERVAERDSEVGTSVAKSEAMTATFSNRPASAVLPHVPVSSIAMVASDRPADSTSSSTLAPEATGTAQRAVEAVLTAADRVGSGEHQTVNLQFSVGGNDLNVRVELRADQVHATFRTDSPELRNALAHEWQAVNASADSDRSLRLASPSFTSVSGSPDSSNLSSFSGGEGFSRQRDSDARRAGEDPFQVVAARARSSAPVASESATVSTAGAARLASSTTSRRLHVQA